MICKKRQPNRKISSKLSHFTAMAEPTPKTSWPLLPIILSLVVPVFISVVLYRPADFDAAAFPRNFGPSIAVPKQNSKILSVSQRIGEGKLAGPEDIAYDKVEGYAYTTCYDGWIRRFSLKEGEENKVEDWVYVGGRPLGLCLDAERNIIVANNGQGLGLLKVKQLDRTIELLSDEAEGLKFALPDGVDVGKDGLIYFTDASCKYDLHMHMLDFLEGRPHGRLLSFDPSTNQTVVLARDLYFANGVSVSPDQQSVIFCETPLSCCKRYYTQGEKKGKVENFIENLPGFPDNIRYDGEGHYWIGIAVGKMWEWDLILKYPLLRKIWFILDKFVQIPTPLRNSGVLKVNLEGQPEAMYYDSNLALVTGGMKIGKYLYYNSFNKHYISRIELLTSDAANLK